MAKKSSPTRSKSTVAKAAPKNESTSGDRLRTYRSKRDFAVTPEPNGDAATDGLVAEARATGRFVVQRHRASALHYDFRLEVDGVLASWAVPRGPSMDPSQRRLAVHVEDHPLGYFSFEGVIPAHEYGGGDVIVWDWGTFQADPDTPEPAHAIDAGEFKFTLDGEKLLGGYVLVRTAGFGRYRASPDGSRAKWLLIHRRDSFAVAGWDAEDEPHSVKTGRTNDEVAEGRRGPRRGPSARRLQRRGPRPVEA